MRRWRLAALALAALLAAPAAQRFGGGAYAEEDDGKTLQYYEMILNSFCSGKCVQGPYCCAIVPVAPNTPG